MQLLSTIFIYGIKGRHFILFIMILRYLKYSSYFIFLLTFSLLWSCHDDESASTPFAVNLATVNTIDSNTKSYSFTLDDGSTLLSKSDLSKLNLKDGYRVFLNYTRLSNNISGFDYEVEVNSISNVLTKSIITTQENDIVGNDPVSIISLWVGDKYLNFRFKLLVGGDNIIHDLNLVYNESRNDTLFFSLRHNANNDIRRYEELSYAAFNLRSLEASLSENTTLVVETTDFNDKIKNYTLRYTENGNSTINSITDNGSISNSIIK